MPGQCFRQKSMTSRLIGCVLHCSVLQIFPETFMAHVSKRDQVSPKRACELLCCTPQEGSAHAQQQDVLPASEEAVCTGNLSVFTQETDTLALCATHHVFHMRK